MTELYEKVRTKLQSKVFGKLGKTISFISKSSPTYNDRGELEQVTETTTNIVAVPYDTDSDTLTYQAFGELKEGETDLAIKYDQTVNIDDEIEMEGIKYRVVNISPNYLPENVVTIIRVSRIEN